MFGPPASTGVITQIIDERTLSYLRMTAREPAQVRLVETYAKAGAPFDINAVGVEFGVLLGSIKRASGRRASGCW